MRRLVERTNTFSAQHSEHGLLVFLRGFPDRLDTQPALEANSRPGRITEVNPNAVAQSTKHVTGASQYCGQQSAATLGTLTPGSQRFALWSSEGKTAPLTTNTPHASLDISLSKPLYKHLEEQAAVLTCARG